jgi:hypothetical protein
VIPNSATQRLIDAAPLAAGGKDAGGAHFVNFLFGDHESFLNPAANAATTLEMQKESVSFISSLGKHVLLTDPTVVQH